MKYILAILVALCLVFVLNVGCRKEIEISKPLQKEESVRIFFVEGAGTPYCIGIDLGDGLVDSKALWMDGVVTLSIIME